MTSIDLTEHCVALHLFQSLCLFSWFCRGGNIFRPFSSRATNKARWWCHVVVAHHGSCSGGSEPKRGSKGARLGLILLSDVEKFLQKKLASFIVSVCTISECKTKHFAWMQHFLRKHLVRTSLTIFCTGDSLQDEMKRSTKTCFIRSAQKRRHNKTGASKCLLLKMMNEVGLQGCTNCKRNAYLPLHDWKCHLQAFLHGFISSPMVFCWFCNNQSPFAVCHYDLSRELLVCQLYGTCHGFSTCDQDTASCQD